MSKITIEDFIKKVNDLKAGEHISVRLVEEGNTITAFAILIRGYRHHFMMLDGLYGNCEMGFEGFQEQGIIEYIDYAKMMCDYTSDMDEITELFVVEEFKNEKTEITLIYGEDAVCEYDENPYISKKRLLELGDIVTTSFDTQKELEAYLKGVNEAIVWNDVTESFEEKHRMK